MKRVGIETAMMTRYDNFDSTLNSRTMNCACCGKEFFGNKSLHTYKRTINKLRRYYCSYRCFRQAEAELDKLKAKEKNISWLREWAFAIAMFSGMLVGYVWDRAM